MREIKQKKDKNSISTPTETLLKPVKDYVGNSSTSETYGVALDVSLLQKILVDAGLSMLQGQSLSWEGVKNCAECAEAVFLPEIWSPEIRKPSGVETIKENARLKDILFNHCLF